MREGHMDNENSRSRMKREPVADIVRGLDPVDWTQVALLANLGPAQRVLTGMRAQAFAMAALRGTLRQRFPDISQSELNMKVLAHFTTLRLPPT